jgi:hypothetical protein
MYKVYLKVKVFKGCETVFLVLVKQLMVNITD